MVALCNWADHYIFMLWLLLSIFLCFFLSSFFSSPNLRGQRLDVYNTPHMVPSSPLKVAQPPVFGSCLIWPNGWMDEDATWYWSRPRPGHIVLDGDPAPRRLGHSSPPSFRLMPIVTMVAHLSYWWALAALCNRVGHYIFVLWFLLLSSFFFFLV